MALSYISLGRRLCEGIAVWLLRSHHSFGDVSAAEEARQPLQCQFAAQQFPPRPGFTSVPAEQCCLGPSPGPDAFFRCLLGTPCYLKSFFSS